MVSSDPFPRGLDQPKCPGSAPAREPAAFNAHKLRDGAGGLVQHVFHLPARMPITAPPSGRPVRRAAKRKTLSVIKINGLELRRGIRWRLSHHEGSASFVS
jgi:hypothetical protein